jgi:hypothetical protein
VKVAAINERNIDGKTLKRLSSVQTAKAATDDHDTLTRFHASAPDAV